jgi:hypothetical protein
MGELLADHSRQLGELTVGQQEAQAQFERLRDIVQGLVHGAERERGYTPTAPPRWWQLDGAAREDAIDELRTWVNTVYRPCYERYSKDLGECWEEHPLALFLLDWMSEWHKYLYLREKRAVGHLTAMAEWHGRFLPIVAEMLKTTTHGCPHEDAAALNGYAANGYVNGAG